MLGGCIWYLYGPWPMCSCCCSDILCAALDCLDVFWPACCGCMLSVLFARSDIPMHCLDVFVTDVLGFMVSATLLESLCTILDLVLAS